MNNLFLLQEERFENREEELTEHKNLLEHDLA